MKTYIRAQWCKCHIQSHSYTAEFSKVQTHWERSFAALKLVVVHSQVASRPSLRLEPSNCYRHWPQILQRHSFYVADWLACPSLHILPAFHTILHEALWKYWGPRACVFRRRCHCLLCTVRWLGQRVTGHMATLSTSVTLRQFNYQTSRRDEKACLITPYHA